MNIYCKLIKITVFSALINACGNLGPLKQQKDAQKQVKLKITSPAENAPKRVLRVETFNTSSCFYDRNLTPDHPDYQGVLFYNENIDNTDISQQKFLTANQPVTIKATLSKVFNSDKSDICYFQPVSFEPQENNSYELYLSSFCEIIIYETNELNKNNEPEKQLNDIRLIDIYSENQDC